MELTVCALCCDRTDDITLVHLQFEILHPILAWIWNKHSAIISDSRNYIRINYRIPEKHLRQAQLRPTPITLDLFLLQPGDEMDQGFAFHRICLWYFLDIGFFHEFQHQPTVSFLLEIIVIAAEAFVRK